MECKPAPSQILSLWVASNFVCTMRDEAEPRAVQERLPARGVGRREASEGRPGGASTRGGPAQEGERAVARAAAYCAARGDCKCGHGRACGWAEHPGLKQGAFLLRSVLEMIRLGPWEKIIALTGLEAERSVSALEKRLSKERRSLGWRWISDQE